MRRFSLGSILSVTTGYLLTDIAEIYDLLSYMTGTSVYTHQIPRVSEECRPAIFFQHPQLIDLDASSITPENYRDCVASWADKYGAELPVAPFTGYESRDPVEELVEMVGADRVSVILPDATAEDLARLASDLASEN